MSMGGGIVGGCMEHSVLIYYWKVDCKILWR